MHKKSTTVIPLLAGVVLLACLVFGLWRFFEQNPLPTLTGESSTTDPATMEDIPEPEYKATVAVGEAFEHTPICMQGILRCTVTNTRLVTGPEDCPPESWFDSPLALIGEDGRAHLVAYDQWFATGGPIDQGCGIVVAEVLMENISAVGLPPEEGGLEDPYLFDVYNLLNLVETTLVRQDPANEQSWYQGYICMGSDVFEKNQALDAQEQQYIRIEQGQSVTVQICFPVHQNDDRTPKDLTKLALVTNSSAYTNEEYLIPLNLP